MMAAPHGATATLTNLCGEQAPPLVEYGGLDHSYQSELAPIDAGSYVAAAEYRWGAVSGWGVKYFSIAPAPASVTPNSFERQYSDPNPPLTGRPRSNCWARDGVTFSYNTAAFPASTPGNYPIVATLGAPSAEGPPRPEQLRRHLQYGQPGSGRRRRDVSFDSTNPVTSRPPHPAAR